MLEKIITGSDFQIYNYRSGCILPLNDHIVGKIASDDVYDTYRTYMSFNTPSILAGKRIKKATLTLTQISGEVGGNENCRIGLFECESYFEVGPLIDYGEPTFLDTAVLQSGENLKYTFDITKLLRCFSRTEMITAFGIKLLDESIESTVNVLFDGIDGQNSPIITVEYENNFAVGTSYQTHTHQLCRMGSGSVDIAECNLMFELEDYSWGGNRMPISIRHLYNTTLYNQQYSNNPSIDLNVASFSAMKLGLGWRLNIMQSMVAHTFRYDGKEYTGYIHTGESGEETLFKPKQATENADVTQTNLNIFEDVNDEETVYDADNRTLNIGGENHIFDECGRLIKIIDEYKNEMVITYQDGKIVSAKDGAGREFIFRYNSDDFLSTIVAPDTSHIIYTYSSDRLCDIFYSGGESLRFNHTTDGRINDVTVYEANGTAAKQYVYDYRAKGIYGVNEYGVKNGLFTRGSYAQYMMFYYDNKTSMGFTAYEDDGTTLSQSYNTLYLFDDDGNLISQTVTNNGVTMGAEGFDPTSSNSTGIMANKGNLLTNHNFDSADNWHYTVPDGITCEVLNDEKTALYGNTVLKVKSENGHIYDRGIYQMSGALPIGKYTFSAYVKIPQNFEGGGDAGAYLCVNDDSDNVIAVSEHFGKKSDGFIRLACTFNIDTESEVALKILLDGKGEIHLDAAQLENNEFANEYDLLTNGNFECGSLAWSLSENAEITNENRFNMQKSLKLVGDFKNICTAEQTVNVKRDATTRESFTLSGWAKGVGVSDGIAQHCLKAVVKYTNATIEDDVFTAFFAPNIDEWQYVSLQFAKKKFATVEQLKIICDYSYNNGTAYFDAVSLNRDGIEKNLTAEDFKDEEEETTESEENSVNSSGEQEEKDEFEEAIDAFGNALTETTFNDEDFGTIYRSFAYGENGNDLIAETDALGNITEYDVDVNTSRNKVITDRLGNKTAYEYDVNGRTTRVTSKTAGNAEIANVAYSYDATDNLSEIMRGDGLKYVLKYNAFKNLESIGIAGKDEKLVNYTYKTSGGRLKEITYANGHKMRASYNRTGNMIAERWYNSDDLLTAYYRYSYDAQGNIVRSVDIFARKEYNYYYEDGVLARSVESDILIDECDFIISKTAVVTVVYVYSDDGELIKKRVIFAGGTEQEFGYQTEQAEDAAEDTQSTTTIETETETSTEIKNESGENGTHDEVIDGEISEENSWNSPSNATSTVQTEEEAEEYKEKVTFKMGETEFVSRSDYDGFGRKSFDELKLKKGFISRQFSYHAGKVTEVHKQKDKLQSAPVTQLVSQIILSDGRTLNYEYDKEERVTKVTDSFEGTTEYTYDALGQLLTETKNGEVVNVMTYDNYGNILSKNDVVYGYADPVWKDKLTKFDGLDITYDSQGNPLNYLGHNLTWEKGRQLKSYDDNTYTYNANGIRTSKTVGGVRHTFTLDGAKILKETWENNTLIPLYDNADEVCGIVYNGTPYYFLKNLQGDVIAITDDNGETVAKYSYDAWGVCTVESDTNGIANINPYRYRSYYYDSEIGMYYLQSRYYNPTVGRFVNGDLPEIVAVELNSLIQNLFAYCGNNAVMYSDCSGYICEEIGVLDSSKVLDGFVRKIDDYVNKESNTWWKKILMGTGNALLGCVKKYKIGVLFTVVSIIWNSIPKINDELGAIRYITDKIRYKFFNKKYSFIVSILFGSHNLQYKLDVKENRRIINTTIIEYRFNGVYTILRNLLIKQKVKLTKRKIPAKYFYK
ncbi:MAG: hypothetical protein IJN93_02115 [Clostridia bacterium]|nr:hypothetical protein [Clostridia bacterium]